MWDQYPNAGDLIEGLPASFEKCFKPEVHLLIEKYLSLKKEISRERFIDNVEDPSGIEEEVSFSYLKKVQRINQFFLWSNAQSFFFIAKLEAPF